jgi:signal transduction histidine kinase/ActR/RegA family two-component response regulator
MTTEYNAEEEALEQMLQEAHALRIKNLKGSIALAEKVLEKSRTQNHRKYIAKSLSELSLFNMIRGEYFVSQKMAEEAILEYEKLNDEKGIADAKYSLGGICYKTDNFHLGLVYLLDCLTIYKKYDDQPNLARTYKAMGTIFEYYGDDNNAIKSYENAIDAGRLAKDPNLVSNAFNPLSGILLNQNKMEESLAMIEESYRMKLESGDVRGSAFALYGRGKVFTKMKLYEEAERDFKEALAIHEESGEALGRGLCYYKLGNLFLQMGKYGAAKEILQKGLEFTVQFKMAIIQFKCYHLLYKVHQKENNPTKALYYLELYMLEKDKVINTQTFKIIENYELLMKVEAVQREATVEKEKLEIVEKQKRAEHTAKVKQEFLSTMSHEIRTPLNALITISSLLSDQHISQEQKQLIESLKSSSNHLLNIVNDILDFTKLEAGKVKLTPVPCNLFFLANNLTNTYHKLAIQKNLAFRSAIAKELSEYYTLDETKVSQILGNLLSNAIKYTEKGIVTLEIYPIEIKEKEHIIRFVVKDTGPGIPEDYKKEIFERFIQPSAVTTRKHGGSGLGLAIVKKLVELYQSQIIIGNNKDEGSTFHFDLQLTPTHNPFETVSVHPGSLIGKNILLVEDNTVNSMVATKLLEKWGVIVEPAYDGFEAIKLSKLKKYDVILMDIHMPEMNGFEATTHIRHQENPNHETPIFALTADITAENQFHGSGYFNGFLRKPIEIEKLFQTLVNTENKPINTYP